MGSFAEVARRSSCFRCDLNSRHRLPRPPCPKVPNPDIADAVLHKEKPPEGGFQIQNLKYESNDHKYTEFDFRRFDEVTDRTLDPSSTKLVNYLPSRFVIPFRYSRTAIHRVEFGGGQDCLFHVGSFGGFRFLVLLPDLDHSGHSSCDRRSNKTTGRFRDEFARYREMTSSGLQHCFTAAAMAYLISGVRRRRKSVSGHSRRCRRARRCPLTGGTRTCRADHAMPTSASIGLMHSNSSLNHFIGAGKGTFPPHSRREPWLI